MHFIVRNTTRYTITKSREKDESSRWNFFEDITDKVIFRYLRSAFEPSISVGANIDELNFGGSVADLHFGGFRREQE